MSHITSLIGSLALTSHHTESEMMVRASQCILSFSGDIQSENGASNLAVLQSLVDIALRFIDCRDEIYAQLCKLVTDNPTKVRATHTR